MKYPLGVTSGTLVAGSGTNGTALNQFGTSGIRYLYVDSSQNIYVSDTYNGRVVRWTSGATAGVVVAGNGLMGPHSIN